MKLEMAQDAKKELDAYFKDKDKGTIRIYLAPGGCSGPRLALALDEKGDGDESTVLDGYTFVINDKLAEQIGGAKIEMNEMGFMIVPENPLPEPEGGVCGGCCGGCGH